MKKQHWLILFVVCLAAELFFIFSDNDHLRTISKPLLMPLLFFFYRAGIGSNAGIRNSIAGALFFSWLGDLLLMFDSKGPLFFILGLSAFLIAHVFYIFFFHNVRIKQGIKPRALLLIPVVVYYGILMSLLSPWLGDLKLPVRVYGVIICFMLMLALHMLFLRNKKAGLLMAVGALLFVISDSVLAINKFYNSFTGAAIIVMLTYGVAQLLIVKGAIDYDTDFAKN